MKNLKFPFLAIWLTKIVDIHKFSYINLAIDNILVTFQLSIVNNIVNRQYKIKYQDF